MPLQQPSNERERRRWERRRQAMWSELKADPEFKKTIEHSQDDEREGRLISAEEIRRKYAVEE